MKMNKDIFEGKWHQIKGEIQKQWAKLTQDEIDQIKGSSEKLAGALQERYGYDKEQAKQAINDFATKHHLNEKMKGPK